MDGHKYHFVQSNQYFLPSWKMRDRLVAECHREVKISGLK